ncbi:site-specific DNA-methyltransferase [Kineobactrum salinum]|uniref:site-specific DNA-methyltransferase (adenine-specific) n=1 Tax=Kineobactrum salinum TaxID=2708301 RepID=A0A6C0TZE9_9GAMM|nr:site-specific DNA-methyltransferase [Kineobactrum salinum]QIB65161.1 site-specific DNA-methyltransferase [Kineobactrum salinum]
MGRSPKPKVKKQVETLTHEEASRKYIPTAEYEPVLHEKDKSAIRVAYERRNRDLDPQLVWRGKDEQDWSDLVVHAPPLYIQEKVHPKVLIDDLRRQTEQAEKDSESSQDDGFVGDLFADFNGLPDENSKTEFYQHDAHWSNRMILGDSLQVMASLAEREGLRGKVQCIYLDPPYGIKFNSNFQWSTTSRDVSDGNVKKITREPEQVKAFRDTWRDGVHSYLGYLRDRLNVARDLLADTGSVFVQIGDENVHRVRALMDEVFGEGNFSTMISFVTTGGVKQNFLATRCDYILWYFKDKSKGKYRQPYFEKKIDDGSAKTFSWVELEDYERRGLTAQEKRDRTIPEDGRLYSPRDLTTQGNPSFEFQYRGKVYMRPWKTTQVGLQRMGKANRLHVAKNSLSRVNYLNDFSVSEITALWTDTFLGSFAEQKQYIVQTSQKTVQRCLLMTTDPGDLVLDPTCGSGTTAYVAEQWGRRWITIDTSRVALALARSRIMGARYPFYLLADSKDGLEKEADIAGTAPSTRSTRGDIRQGFVYERVPHITLKSIANNSEIDVIWDKFQEVLEPLLGALNKVVGEDWQEWEIPRETDDSWNGKAKDIHAKWWEKRTARQNEIDASIAAKADFEYLYDKPYEDKKKVRVAGPFTVESLSPHRALAVGVDDELIDISEKSATYNEVNNFAQMILENLKTAGVQQAHKVDKIDLISLTPWPGELVCAEGVYVDEGDEEKRAAIFIGPEFGTVSRPDLVQAAREAADAAFDVLIACAFNYDAHSTEFEKLGRVPVLKARMNADLHMSDDLKNTGKGNLFVIFGEPDIDIQPLEDHQIQVQIRGVDVFHPNTGEVRSDGAEGIACWFIDTDYNEESFFVRHAYFLGANDPYKSLKTTLKAEINQEAWDTLNSDTSRPFEKPKSGRIAVKVINHLGDEVMKVYKV